MDLKGYFNTSLFYEFWEKIYVFDDFQFLV